VNTHCLQGGKKKQRGRKPTRVRGKKESKNVVSKVRQKGIPLQNAKSHGGENVNERFKKSGGTMATERLKEVIKETKGGKKNRPLLQQGVTEHLSRRKRGGGGGLKFREGKRGRQKKVPTSVRDQGQLSCHSPKGENQTRPAARRKKGK